MSTDRGHNHGYGLGPSTWNAVRYYAEDLRGVRELDEPFTLAEFKDAVGWNSTLRSAFYKLKHGGAIEVVCDAHQNEAGNSYRLAGGMIQILADLDETRDTMPNCDCRVHVPPGTGPYECDYCGAECSRAELEAVL